MRTTVKRNPGDVLLEQPDRAGVGRYLAGDQVEQRGLAGAIGPDDQSAISVRARKIDVGGDPQAAKVFAKIADAERGHGTRSSLGNSFDRSLGRAAAAP